MLKSVIRWLLRKQGTWNDSPLCCCHPRLQAGHWCRASRRKWSQINGAASSLTRKHFPNRAVEEMSGQMIFTLFLSCSNCHLWNSWRRGAVPLWKSILYSAMLQEYRSNEFTQSYIWFRSMVLHNYTSIKSVKVSISLKRSPLALISPSLSKFTMSWSTSSLLWSPAESEAPKYSL